MPNLDNDNYDSPPVTLGCKIEVLLAGVPPILGFVADITQSDKAYVIELIGEQSIRGWKRATGQFSRYRERASGRYWNIAGEPYKIISKVKKMETNEVEDIITRDIQSLGITNVEQAQSILLENIDEVTEYFNEMGFDDNESAILGYLTDYTRNCAGCSKTKHRDSTKRIGGVGTLCTDCIATRTLSACNRCRGTFDSSFLQDYTSETTGEVISHVCIDCINGFERELNTIRTRSSWGEHVTSAKFGEVIKSKRKWGVELEFLVPDKKKKEIARALNGVNLKTWALGTDGSLGSRDTDTVATSNAFELRSTPFAGEKGEIAARAGMRDIAKAGGFVNNTCGTHIHLQVLKNSFEKMRAILLAYYYADKTIQSFLPPSRKTNNYCKTLQGEWSSNHSIQAVWDAKTTEELGAIWYSCSVGDFEYNRRDLKHSTRKYGVNFHLLMHRNILEIRYHSGTLNPNKVLEWVNLHARLIDWAEKLPSEDAIRALNTGNEATRTYTLFQTLGLTEDSRNYFLQRQAKFHAMGEIRENEIALPIEKSMTWQELKDAKIADALCAA